MRGRVRVRAPHLRTLVDMRRVSNRVSIKLSVVDALLSTHPTQRHQKGYPSHPSLIESTKWEHRNQFLTLALPPLRQRERRSTFSLAKSIIPGQSNQHSPSGTHKHQHHQQVCPLAFSRSYSSMTNILCRHQRSLFPRPQAKRQARRIARRIQRCCCHLIITRSERKGRCDRSRER